MKTVLYNFVLGLAYALERAANISPVVPSGTKAYLFPLGQRDVFTGFMRSLDSTGLPQGEIHNFVRVYTLEPSVFERMVWFSIDNSFDVVDETTIFARSVLTKKARSVASDYYDRNKHCFDFLVKVLVQTEFRLKHGIELVFIGKDQ